MNSVTPVLIETFTMKIHPSAGSQAPDWEPADSIFTSPGGIRLCHDRLLIDIQPLFQNIDEKELR
jgi:hypothetical protein